MQLFFRVVHFLSLLCFFFAMFLVSDKSQMNGSSEADCKKNDGFGLIRTGDPRNVKTEDLGLFKAFSVGVSP
jgi:hypothetical protein